MELEALSGHLAGLWGNPQQAPSLLAVGWSPTPISLPMVKTESHFQADPVSRDAAGSFAEDPEEQEDGASES